VRTPLAWQFLLLTGLSLSIGWGIRGQFGHEYGAAMAGSLGCLAVAILSGRQDWHRRAAYFAMFGGIGWAIGGSMSAALCTRWGRAEGELKETTFWGP
jgi:hypothetical protein